MAIFTSVGKVDKFVTVDKGAMQATGVSGNWTGVCVRAWFGAVAGAAGVT